MLVKDILSDAFYDYLVHGWNRVVLERTSVRHDLLKLLQIFDVNNRLELSCVLVN